MSEADLSGAFNTHTFNRITGEVGKQLTTNEELQQQAKSLKGATMPNGQKYEDWLKSRGEGDSGS